mgnify:CR=1 FL=1
MEKQKNIAEFQEKFTIPVPANIAKIVDARDRKILAESYLKLFSGFSWVNWTNGYSLGRAWQTALRQCETFIKTKKANNPALKHLDNTYKSHKKYWSRVIMTHRNSENKISGTSEWVAQMRAYGMQLIREAMDKINLILARYNERIEELLAEQQMTHSSTQAKSSKNMSGGAIQSGNHNGGITAEPKTATAQQKNTAENTNEHQAKLVAAQEQNAHATQSAAHQTNSAATAPERARAAQQSHAAAHLDQADTTTVSKKQALERATEKLTRQVSLPAQKSQEQETQKTQVPYKTPITKQAEIAQPVHKRTATKPITMPQVQPQLRATQAQVTKPQLSGLVRQQPRPTPHVMNVAKLQNTNTFPAVRKPQIKIAPQVKATQPATPQVNKPQLSGLVQHRAQQTPRIASVAKLQTSINNNVIRTPKRPNINVMLFKNFNQRIA